MNIINSKISKLITYLMNEQNLSIKNLSQLSGLSEKTISKIIDCKIEPTINMLSKICNVFSINTCEFFDTIIIENYITA